jgi:hypothetical protein
MKLDFRVVGAALVVSLLGITQPQVASAQVSSDDFNALKKLVEELNEKVKRLEQDHDKDAKTHDQDQQQIQQLKLQLGETQKTATEAQQKAEAASTIQPVHPVPPGSGLDATHNFTMVGDAEVQFGKVDSKHSAFVLADFAPIFLFRARDNILFEAGFDINLQNNAPNGSDSTTSIGLSFAQLDWLMNDYVTFVGGYMVLPLGTYSERAAGWLNKIPDDPFARDLLPGSAAGVQLRGSVPLGDSGQSIAYSVFGVNGPGSVDGSGNHDQFDPGGNVGIQSDGTFGNLHGNPSGGGRIGWFYPFKPHYDVELGLSGQAGPWDNAGDRLWSAAVVDAAVHVGPNIEVKGEYINTWLETDDLGTIKPRGWWLQGAYKLAGLNLDLPYINNVELVGRYDKTEDGAGTKTDRYTIGYVYYITNTLLFEGDYEFINSNDPAQDHNVLLFQLSMGF